MALKEFYDFGNLVFPKFKNKTDGKTKMDTIEDQFWDTFKPNVR